MFGKKWILFIILTILVVGVYFNSLNNDFLSDDIPSIVQNKNIGEFTWPGPAFLRSYLNDALYKIWDFNPLPYRAVNILFHLGCVYLVFILFNKITNNKFLSFFIASVFSVHPIINEPIVWISGGLYPQYTFFVLLSLLFYINKNKKAYYLSLIFFALALLSSEKAVIFPLIILLYDVCFDKIKKTWKKVLPYFILSGGWALIYLSRITQRVNDLQTQFYHENLTLNPLYQIPTAISSYLELFFWPEKLTIYHTEMSFGLFEFGIRALVVILFLILIVWVYKKSKKIFFWLVFFIISLLPT
ncbi:hypothetical protein ACFL1Y_02080, partial [Patescibacteria group bacterium]